MKSIEFPQYLDVLLIIDDKATKSKILKLLDRSKDYITKSLRYLEQKELIKVTRGAFKDSKVLLIELTPKGHDVQNIVTTLYNIMGIQK